MTLDERLSGVELLLLDVDGVLTDGKIRIDDHGVETKAFDVTDGHGLKMLGRAGVRVGIVTGRTSRVVEHRARELSIDIVRQGCKDKLATVRDILRETGLAPDRVAFMGDDVVDLPVMLQVRLAVSVPAASEDVRSCAHWVTRRGGGDGAVREVCDALIKARGRWDELTRKYFFPEPL